MKHNQYLIERSVDDGRYFLNGVSLILNHGGGGLFTYHYHDYTQTIYKHALKACNVCSLLFQIIQMTKSTLLHPKQLMGFRKFELLIASDQKICCPEIKCFMKWNYFESVKLAIMSVCRSVRPLILIRRQACHQL